MCVPGPPQPLEEPLHPLLHDVAAIERHDRDGVEHTDQQVEPPKPEGEVDRTPEEGERFLPGYLFGGISKQDCQLLGVTLDEGIDGCYRQVEWRKETEVCDVSKVLLHRDRVVIVDSHEPGVPVTVEHLRPFRQGEGIRPLDPIFLGRQGDHLPGPRPIHDSRYLLLVRHRDAVYPRYDRVALEPRVGRREVFVDTLDERDRKRRRHPHKEEHQPEADEASDDVIGYTGAEHPYLRHPLRRIDIRFIGLDKCTDGDDGNQDPHAPHPHILNTGKDGVTELVDDDREQKTDEDSRGDRYRLVDTWYGEDVPGVVDTRRLRGVHQKLGDREEQGERHEGRDHHDHDDAERCVGAERPP